MSEPFMGQIMQVGFSFAPRGWMTCQGQILSIAQQSALFSLLGTTYGGNGQTTFGLPDARGRTFVGTGQGPGLQPYSLGQIGGTENTTLTINQMPMHNHVGTFTPSGSLGAAVQAMTGVAYGAETGTPAEGSFLGSVLENDTAPRLYVPAGTSGTAVNLGGVSITGTAGGSVTVGPNGGSQPFGILSPYLSVTTIIAVEGIFPSRN
jgi:microcystin-dependent protein